MRRLTGPIVSQLRRTIARFYHVKTSDVKVFRGRELRPRQEWRHTWRVVVDGNVVRNEIWWANIVNFCDLLTESYRLTP